jgi:hypothetical protein
MVRGKRQEVYSRVRTEVGNEHRERERNSEDMKNRMKGEKKNGNSILHEHYLAIHDS